MLGFRTTISLFAILFIPYLMIPVFAQDALENTISVVTNSEEYHLGDTMVISGSIGIKKMPVVALKIFNSNGGILSANELEIKDDNTFTKTITLDSPFYDDPGTYTITVDYSKLSAKTNFEIVGGQEKSHVTSSQISSSPEILAMFTDQEVYENGDTITIIGLVSEKVDDSVLVGIYDPAGNPAGFYFGQVDSNDEFSVSFLAKNGVNFKTEGIYWASAFYGDSEDLTSFEYVKQNSVQANPVDENKNTNTNTNTESKSKENTVNNNQVNTPTSNTVNNKQTSTTNNQPSENNQIKTKKNLSVEDVQLGIMLNEIKLKCDTSEFTDTLSYSEGMGPALMRLCKYSDAIYFYDQTLQNDPNNVDILINKGSAFAKMGLYYKAIAQYDQVLALQPNNYMALNNKANALANLGNVDQAMTLYDAALFFAPDDSVILKNLYKAQDKLSVLKINNDIEVKTNTPIMEITEEKENNQSISSKHESSIFEQLGNALSSIFNIFGWKINSWIIF